MYISIQQLSAVRLYNAHDSGLNPQWVQQTVSISFQNYFELNETGLFRLFEINVIQFYLQGELKASVEPEMFSGDPDVNYDSQKQWDVFIDGNFF